MNFQKSWTNRIYIYQYKRGDLLQELAAVATEVKKFYKRSSGCNFQSKFKSQKTQGRGKGCYSKNPESKDLGTWSSNI